MSKRKISRGSNRPAEPGCLERNVKAKAVQTSKPGGEGNTRRHRGDSNQAIRISKPVSKGKLERVHIPNSNSGDYVDHVLIQNGAIFTDIPACLGGKTLEGMRSQLNRR